MTRRISPICSYALCIYMMSSSPDGEGLLFDKPITEIEFMMKHESMVAELAPCDAKTP